VLIQCASKGLPKVTGDGGGGSRFEELDVPQAKTPYAGNLTPGMIALVEDVEGRGHTNTVRSAGPATFLAIPLAD
jgi:hypothetical protein